MGRPSATAYITNGATLLSVRNGGVEKFRIDKDGLITTASVNSASIVDGSVATADIQDGSVTPAKLASVEYTLNRGSIGQDQSAGANSTITVVDYNQAITRPNIRISADFFYQETRGGSGGVTVSVYVDGSLSYMSPGLWNIGGGASGGFFGDTEYGGLSIGTHHIQIYIQNYNNPVTLTTRGIGRWKVTQY